MILVPQSIQAPNTLAIDSTFTERLSLVGTPQLLIDLQNERDIKKLSLYLQQFGIPIELLPTDLSALQFRRLLQNILHIYRLSGSAKSIKMLATSTGATAVEIIKHTFTLTHTRQSRHNHLHHYNKGKTHRHFTISLKIQGIPLSQQTTYNTTLTKLFQIFQPINIHLVQIIHQTTYQKNSI